MSNLVLDVEGMKTYVVFDVIEFVYGEGSYHTFLGIEWANDSMEVINFKKHMMTFENQDIRVIVHMDPNEGKRYIEPMKDEVVRGWDHDYNSSIYYIHPTIDGKLGWFNGRYTSSDSDDALEKFKKRMHEV